MLNGTENMAPVAKKMFWKSFRTPEDNFNYLYLILVFVLRKLNLTSDIFNSN